MIKSISELNKKMPYVLKDVCKRNGELVIDLYDKDVRFALHECLQKGYLENLEEWIDANGDFHFNKMGEIRVSSDGLKFIQETTCLNSILQGVFKIFRGFLGYVIGIISSLIIAYFVWKFGWNN